MTSFSTVTPHFFKAVLESTLRDSRLLIPKKFVRKYGETLSNPVFVKLPCGSEWKMELRKSDGRVWLGKGWPEFAGNYSIVYGDLLVFRYEGNSRFHAYIFDKTTVEIDYPLIPSHYDELNGEKITDDHESVEILEDFSPCLRKRKSSPLPCSQPHKKSRACPIGKTESSFSHLRPRRTHAQSNGVILENSMSNRDSHCSDSEMKEGNGDNSTTPRRRKCEVVKRMQQFTSKYEAKSLHRDDGFESESQTCQIVMKPSHLIKYYDMTFPSYFAKSIIKNKSCDATLELSNGGTWPVKFATKKSENKYMSARFQKHGWKKFAQDNNLKVGDVCIFNLIIGNQILVKFSILQAVDDSYGHPSHAGRKTNLKVNIKSKCSSNSGAFEAASRFSSTNPFFRKTVEVSNLKQCIQQVPVDFGKRYIGQKTQMVTLQVGKKSWSVNVAFYSPSSYIFTNWLTFSKENFLHPGDVCVYELIKENPIVLRVFVFRVNASWISAGNCEANPIQLFSDEMKNVAPVDQILENHHGETSYVKPGNIKFGPKSKDGLTNHEVTDDNLLPSSRRKRAFEAATSQFSSKNPYFKVELRGSCFRILHIPVNFSRSYFEEKRQNIINVELEVGEKVWPGTMVTCPKKRKTYFSGGWPAFARENHLQPGDFCNFELFRREMDPLLLKVTIFRCTTI